MYPNKGSGVLRSFCGNIVTILVVEDSFQLLNLWDFVLNAITFYTSQICINTFL